MPLIENRVLLLGSVLQVEPQRFFEHESVGQRDEHLLFRVPEDRVSLEQSPEPFLKAHQARVFREATHQFMMGMLS